jgi:adenine phosphoribosyltransferase
LIDDVLATGGTASAAATLLAKAGGKLAGYGFVIELLALEGREQLPKAPVFSLITYS